MNIYPSPNFLFNSFCNGEFPIFLNFIFNNYCFCSSPFVFSTFCYGLSSICGTKSISL